MTYEGIRLKILKIKRKAFAKIRKKYLKFTDFTIISNNCWGGMIYESYNLPKNSPTIGMFFMAQDYIKFISRINYYISKELVFIKPEQSRWKKQVSLDKRFGSYPIGLLDDVEIFFLHYHSEQEAREKWDRRCKRINWDRLLIKFNDQNGCTEDEIKDFFSLPYSNKIFFTCKDWDIPTTKECVKIKQFTNEQSIMTSYEPFGKSKYIDITKMINSL